MTRVGS